MIINIMKYLDDVEAAGIMLWPLVLVSGGRGLREHLKTGV